MNAKLKLIAGDVNTVSASPIYQKVGAVMYSNAVIADSAPSFS